MAVQDWPERTSDCFIKWTKTLSHSPQVSRLPLLLSHVICHEAFMAQVIGSKCSVTMSKDGRL